MRKTGIKLAIVSVLSISIYLALIQLSFGREISGAIASGISIGIVQIGLEEIGFYRLILD